MHLGIALSRRAVVCLALCGQTYGVVDAQQSAPAPKKTAPLAKPSAAAKRAAAAKQASAALPSESPDFDTILPNDNERRMAALADLRENLGDAKRAAIEAEAHLKEEQRKLAAILTRIGELARDLSLLNSSPQQNQDAEVIRRKEIFDKTQEMQGLEKQAKVTSKAADDAALELQAKLESLDQLRVRWFHLMDFFDRLSREDHQSSIAKFDSWLQQTPDDQAVHLARSVAYGNVGWFDKALVDLTPLIDAAGPGVSDCLAFQGLLLCQSKRDRDGVASLSQAIKLDKRCLAAYVYRAQINLTHDNCENAMRDLQLAQKIDREHPEPLRLSALIQATCDKPSFRRNAAGAVASAERACEITKRKDWRSLEALAAAYAEDGKFEEALRSIDAAAGLTKGVNRARIDNWKKEFEAKKPIRLSPRECAGLVVD